MGGKRSLVKICIAGWYFREQFLRDVSLCGYDAFVVKHREGDTQCIPFELHPNVGLEFGAYGQYVNCHWDGVSDVLFLHDDAAVSDLSAFEQAEHLAAIGVDHAYIFHDENEDYVNGGAHGRGMWIRGSVLKELASDFPADWANTGVNIGVTAQAGILKFHKRIMRCSPNTGVIAIIPQFRFAHRGRLHEKMFVYRKTHNSVPGGLVNV